MRVLEIAAKHGQKIDLSKGLKCHNVTQGNVPVSTEINGVSVSINESDLTTKEAELLKWAKGEPSTEVAAGAKEQTVPNKGTRNEGGVHIGPDIGGIE